MTSNPENSRSPLASSLQSAVDSISKLEPPQAALDRVLQSALLNNNRTNTKRVTGGYSRYIWKIAALAASMLFVIGLLNIGTGSQSSLYAQMQESLAKVNTIRCTWYFQLNSGEREGESEVFIQEPNFVRIENRQELSDGTFNQTLVFNLETEQAVMIDELSKSFIEMPIYDVDQRKMSVSKMIDKLRGGLGARKSLGDETVDGKDCEVFEVSDKAYDCWVAIDKDSKLPVQIRVQDFAANRGSHVTTNFVFDEPMDQSLFHVLPPEGFKVDRREFNEAVDDSDLVLFPGIAIGDAKFGMTMEEVVFALGKPDSVSEMKLTSRVEDDGKKVWKGRDVYYDSRGFSVFVSENHGMIAAVFTGGAEHLTTSRSFKGRFGDSIRIGSSRDEVIASFGQPNRAPNPNFGETPEALIYVLPNGHSMRFTFDSDKLVFATANHHFVEPDAGEE